ncbi:hypothetical protein [Flavobacterium johnsoniae]|uniref:hypothetical protein n=1 Tax=Flavobacterium johnsoniae TaxID=986 RepID=UPI0011EE73A7|nr:hypothetical protein [Flavobacterium johnsoniae]
MDENPEMIMIGFAPADFLLAVVAPELRKSIEESWDTVVFDLAEKAKDKGLKGVDEFLQSPGGKDERYRFTKTSISQDTLNKLLKGEFKSLKELTNAQDNSRIKMDKYQYENSLVYTLFHYIKKDEEANKNLIIIDTVFINQKK